MLYLYFPTVSMSPVALSSSLSNCWVLKHTEDASVTPRILLMRN